MAEHATATIANAASGPVGKRTPILDSAVNPFERRSWRVVLMSSSRSRYKKGLKLVAKIAT